ncbi:MAG: hypothetical protein ACTSXU_00900, partial [Promethearchaeota archaeon]
KQLRALVEFMTEKDAKSLIKKYLTTAQSSIDLGIYDDARKNYELAKEVAKQMNFFKEIEKIQKKIDELSHFIFTLEYDNSMKKAVNAEKNKDYLKAIQNYTRCKQLLLDIFDYSPTHKRIQQIDKRIQNLQAKVR